MKIIVQLLLFVLLSLNCRAAIVPILRNTFTTNTFDAGVGGAIPYFDYPSGKFVVTPIAYSSGITFDPSLGFLSVFHTNYTGDFLLVLQEGGAAGPSIQVYSDRLVVANTNLSFDAVGPFGIQWRVDGSNVLQSAAGGVSLSGKTNVVADNGATVTYNGTPIPDLFGTLSRIPASTLVYTNIFLANLPALTNNDLYAIPAGKIGMLSPSSAIIGSTTNATATSCVLLVKTNGNYFRVTIHSNVATNTPILLAATGFIWGEGDTIAMETANAGVNVWLDLILFPTNSTLKGYRITNFTTGTNLLYTVPAGRVAVDLNRTSPVIGTTVVNFYNFSGTSRTNSVYRVPSGAVPAANNLMISGKVVANDAATTVTLSGFLGSGESIVISPDVNVVTGQVAWLSVAEIPFP